MSTSLRDQLLQAGLVNQKQVKEAERQQERHARQQPKHARPPVAPAAPRADAANVARDKTARDHTLNQRQQEKAQRKALQAQIKQLIDRNRVPPIVSEDRYHFADGGKIRHIAVNAAVRGALIAGEFVIVRHEGRYSLVPAATAARIAERDPSAVMPSVAGASTVPDDAYPGFEVPDDLVW